MYMARSNGLSTLPCGTPDVYSWLVVNARYPTATYCVRPVMQERSQPSALPLIPRSVPRRSRRMSHVVVNGVECGRNVQWQQNGRLLITRWCDNVVDVDDLQQRISRMSKTVSRLTLAEPSCRHHMWPQAMHRQLLEYLGHRAQVGDRPVVFSMSNWSSPDFFSNGVTRPCLSDDGNTPALKDMLASLAISGPWHQQWTCEVMLACDDLADSERITFATSSKVIAASSSSRHAWSTLCTGWRWYAGVVDRCAVTVSAIFCSLSMKNRQKPLHSLAASCRLVSGGRSSECNISFVICHVALWLPATSFSWLV